MCVGAWTHLQDGIQKYGTDKPARYLQPFVQTGAHTDTHWRNTHLRLEVHLEVHDKHLEDVERDLEYMYMHMPTHMSRHIPIFVYTQTCVAGMLAKRYLEHRHNERQPMLEQLGAQVLLNRSDEHLRLAENWACIDMSHTPQSTWYNRCIHMCNRHVQWPFPWTHV